MTRMDRGVIGWRVLRTSNKAEIFHIHCLATAFLILSFVMFLYQDFTLLRAYGSLHPLAMFHPILGLKSLVSSNIRIRSRNLFPPPTHDADGRIGAKQTPWVAQEEQN